jgi:CMP-N-acetylneuraminic acid synthetase
MKQILGLIPARGGSKGVPQKNIRKLGNIPLIFWTIDIALQAHKISRLVLSSDSKEIIDIVKKRPNVEIPFIRPSHLGDDNTPMTDVIKHCIQFYEDIIDFHMDAVILLQPTTPFRSAIDIDTAINLFFEKKASSIVSVSKVPSHFNPEWQLKINGAGLITTYSDQALSTLKPRRQELSDTFYRNGEIYVFNPKNIKEENNIYGDRVFPVITSGKVNIDSLDDFRYAEFLLNAGDIK